MIDVDVRAYELSLQGRCCAQVMVRLALEERGEENEQMADAVGVLCQGMFSGIGCGALEGGAMAMWLLADRPVDRYVIEELVDWFRGRFEATDCRILIADDLMARYTNCPAMLAETSSNAPLAQAGHLF